MTTPTASLDVHARLCAAVEQLERRLALPPLTPERAAATDLWPLTPTPVSLGTLPSLRSSDGGPNGGYFWAVQRVTVGPIGATTDLVSVYRGTSSFDVQPQNALQSFFSTVVGSFVTWHPGGKGLVLMPDQAIVAGGTITGTNPMLSMDVIQGTLAQLAAYLS